MLYKYYFLVIFLFISCVNINKKGIVHQSNKKEIIYQLKKELFKNVELLLDVRLKEDSDLSIKVHFSSKSLEEKFIFGSVLSYRINFPYYGELSMGVGYENNSFEKLIKNKNRFSLDIYPKTLNENTVSIYTVPSLNKLVSRLSKRPKSISISIEIDFIYIEKGTTRIKRKKVKYKKEKLKRI